MSDYGCCTLGVCVHQYESEFEEFTCDQCPYYDKYFFKKDAEAELEQELLMEQDERQHQL